MNALATTTNVNLGGSPRLTLHIEADTLPDLMAAINAVMGGLDPAATEFAGYDEAVEGSALGATIHAHAPAEGPKRGRGRPRKDEAAAPPAEPAPPAPTPAAAVDPLAAAMAAQVAPPAEPAPAPALDATMQALTPDAARLKGIELVQAHFAKHPDCLPQIQAISQKYGVAQFKDVPDAEAHRFLADITLLTNGTGQV